MRRSLRIVAITAAFASVVLGSSLIGCGSCNNGEGDGDGGSGTTNTGPTKVHGLTEEQAGQPLVKIGEDTIVTVGDLAERLADQSPYLRARYESPERRLEFLETMVRFELLAHEALRRGLDEEPEVQRVRKQLMIQALMKTEFEDQIRLADITDDEIRAYYEAHADEFHKPEQVRAAHILIKNRATAERTLRELQAAPTDANLFRETAGRLNEDEATKDHFGDLGFFYRDGHRDATTDHEVPHTSVPAPVAEAAFGLENIGAIGATLVETPEGFHIVKLTARRAALDRSLDESERPIRNRLWREKRESAIGEFVERLRREANIEENWDLLSEVHVDVQPGAGNTPTLTPETDRPLPGPDLIPGTTQPRIGPQLPPTKAPPRPAAPTPPAP